MFCVKKNTVFSEVVHFHFKDRDIVIVIFILDSQAKTLRHQTALLKFQ